MSRPARLALIAAAVVLVCIIVITRLSDGGSPRGPVQQLARMRPVRSFAPMLSIPTRYHACTLEPADSGRTVPREVCGTDDEESPILGALAAAGESPDPDSLQASALVALIWWDEKDALLTEAISRLEKALRLTRDQVPLLVDLSAAYLVRAERTQNPRDLAAGLEAALEALVLEPGNAAARFNVALALQASYVDEQAALAWDAYLAIDSTSDWADEARRRKDSLITQVVKVAQPAEDASAEEVVRFVVDHPQEAREMGWDSVLGDWGAAMEAGDSLHAASLLSLAERLGRALQQRPGGDASLADAVNAIRAVRNDAAATAALARAHRAYGVGRAHFDGLRSDSAWQAFDQIAAAKPPSPALLQWTELFRAGALAYLRKDEEAKSVLRALLPYVNGDRHPALEARTRLMLGTLLHRNTEYTAAREQLRDAAGQFHRAGEPALMGAALSTESEAAYEQGDTLIAYRTMHEAMRILRPHRHMRWLHNNLSVLARFASLDGMWRAALPVYDEQVPLALRLRIGTNVVQAFHDRAQARAMIGDAHGAAQDQDSAATVADTLKDPEAGTWARALIRTGRTGSRYDAAAMDAAVAVFKESNNVMWLFPALIRRADARLANGDPDGATADLEAVAARTQQLSDRASDVRLRAAMIEQARSRFDSLVMLHVRANRPVPALRALERGRVSFAPRRDAHTALEDTPLSAPRGEVALEYALIGDTLLTWAIGHDSIYLVGQPVDQDEFLLTVEQARAALESPARAAGALPHLQRLYDWLIRPMHGHLGELETPLIILADGEIAGVPFAALRDSVQNRYLFEDHLLRFAATLADAVRTAPEWRDGRALLVADPAFDPDKYPELDPLRGARAEVQSLSRLYPNHMLLAGDTATRDTFITSMLTASVVHYAGHAVFDDARPERSFLVLAGADTTGRLSAEAVGSMQLGGVRLVVLSACRTLRSRGGRSGGFAGLSGALLAAGADGVVGSLWQVNDSLAQPLMLAFHREYQRSGDPARALQVAQRAMLDSGNPQLSSPALWAGFRYAGSRSSRPAQ